MGPPWPSTRARTRFYTGMHMPHYTPVFTALGALATADPGDGAHFQEIALLSLLCVLILMILLSVRKQIKSRVNAHLSVVRKQETQMLEVTTAIARELQLQPLLRKIMDTVTEILGADRSTLFLFDSKTKELWSNVAQGIGENVIRFPANAGIAGTVFTTGETVNIPDVYKDKRFNKEVDRKTGYRTTSMLCIQVMTKTGVPLGVMQVLNKQSGPFTEMDEQRLRAFCSQTSIAIENAQLFDEIVTVKNYNEAILESMKSGLITIDADGHITKANQAAHDLLLDPDGDDTLLMASVEELFNDHNTWVARSVRTVLEGGYVNESLDASLTLPCFEELTARHTTAVNVSFHPLLNVEGKAMGCLVVLEDITSEKRLRSTMARYMTKEVADKLLEGGEAALGGSVQRSTVLFSDIRAFTNFSERNGAQETVSMLNDYFGVMVDLIMTNHGILDKYIGDAIMAVFGSPFSTPQDADNALRTAIEMHLALDRFNAERLRVGKESIRIGIGVNTDEVVSGNIGSAKRMDYTVIGDGVNLAARLESATKTYGTRLLISEFTANDLQGKYLLREVDRLRVRGKDKPVTIYEALDAYPESTLGDPIDLLAAHHSALVAYRNRDWPGAIDGFDKVLGMRSDDPLANLYRQRCMIFQDSEPSEDWDGTWLMTTK
jgi:adenylate cyclase